MLVLKAILATVVIVAVMVGGTSYAAHKLEIVPVPFLDYCVVSCEEE